MKTIEEFENLDFSELEKISADGSVPVPSGLEDRIRNGLAAETLVNEERRSREKFRKVYWSLGAAAFAAVFATVIALIPSRPKDTFDDPALAYAEVERTFAYISSKMDRGMEIASTAEPVIGRTIDVLTEPLMY